MDGKGIKIDKQINKKKKKRYNNKRINFNYYKPGYLLFI